MSAAWALILVRSKQIARQCFIGSLRVSKSRNRALVSTVAAKMLNICDNDLSYIKPRFSIRPLLWMVKRLNLREKNQKMFIDVEWLRLPLIFCFFSHIFNPLITLATRSNGKSGLNLFHNKSKNKFNYLKLMCSSCKIDVFRRFNRYLLYLLLTLYKQNVTKSSSDRRPGLLRPK